MCPLNFPAFVVCNLSALNNVSYHFWFMYLIVMFRSMCTTLSEYLVLPGTRLGTDEISVI